MNAGRSLDISRSSEADFRSRPATSDMFGALADGGETLMPLDDYGSSRRFGWINDRFGVSWQLNLPA